MPFMDEVFGPVTFALMQNVLEAACREAEACGLTGGTTDHSRSIMASAILAAVKRGDRCEQSLRALAIKAVDRQGQN